MIKVAVCGATGAVGREMVEELSGASGAENVDLRLFSSPRSAGSRMEFRGKSLEVERFTPEALADREYVLMSAGGGFAKEHAEGLVGQGATVIDNSSAFRMTTDVPLIVPEVNGETLDDRARPLLVANPNCSTIQMVVALKPLKEAFGLEWVNVSTYQSVSGSGQKGVSELSEHLRAQMKFEDPQPEVFPKPIPFNVIPGIDRLDGEGHAYEEVKMVQETRKIFRIPELAIHATTVRVPVFCGHGEAVTVRLAESITREDAAAVFREAEGVVFHEADDYVEIPTPRDVAGDGQVHVSRVRLPWGDNRSPILQFWNVADNLKKGAATNAVQIWQRLVEHGGSSSKE